jgi:uncharacterized protein (TIGR03067 family)
MKLWTALSLSLALALVGFTGRADEKDAKKAEDKDAQKIEGRYELVGGEENGKEVPADRVKGAVVVITGTTIVGTDKDKKEFFTCTYTLDTAKKPWKITMTSKEPKEGEKSEGIVEMEGNTLKICYAVPGGKTPTSFKTEDKQNCFVLKKIEK